jgi:hypothetical protein
MPLVLVKPKRDDCRTCIGLGELGDETRCPTCGGSGKKKKAADRKLVEWLLEQRRVAALELHKRTPAAHAEFLRAKISLIDERLNALQRHDE